MVLFDANLIKTERKIRKLSRFEDVKIAWYGRATLDIQLEFMKS